MSRETKTKIQIKGKPDVAVIANNIIHCLTIDTVTSTAQHSTVRVDSSLAATSKQTPNTMPGKEVEEESQLEPLIHFSKTPPFNPQNQPY